MTFIAGNNLVIVELEGGWVVHILDEISLIPGLVEYNFCSSLTIHLFEITSFIFTFQVFISKSVQAYVQMLEGLAMNIVLKEELKIYATFIPFSATIN